MASSSFSHFGYTKVLSNLFKGETFTPPAMFYVALMRTTPNIDGTGGLEVSTSGTGYSRKPVGQWSGPNGAALIYQNMSNIDFDSPIGDWGTINGIALYDAQVGGNMWMVGRGTAKIISASDGAPVIKAGELRVNMAMC